MRKSAAVLAALVLIGCPGCGVRPEQPLVERFFELSRLRDKTALQRFATVTFEPRDQGIVRTFEITDVTPEQQSRDIVSKQVTISAPVELPDGRTVQKTIIITMQRSLAPAPGPSPAPGPGSSPTPGSPPGPAPESPPTPGPLPTGPVPAVSGFSRTDWTITGVAVFQPSPRS